MNNTNTVTTHTQNNNNNKTNNYFNIKSIWSKAGIGTCIILEQSISQHKKKGKIVLDIGATPNFDKTISSKYVLISHGHIDHIGAIGCHARSHNMMYNGSCPTYFVPIDIVSKVQQMITVMSELDNCEKENNKNETCCSVKKKMNVNIIGVKPGDEIELNHHKNYFKSTNNNERLFLRAFAVNHGTTPALGYTIIRKIKEHKKGKSKLKTEYQSLSSKEIHELIKQGINVKIEERKDDKKDNDVSDDNYTVEVGYTGDTNVYGLLASDNTFNQNIKSCDYLHEAITKSYILFCELTFIDNDKQNQQQLAIEKGHLHISNIQTFLQSHAIDYTVPLLYEKRKIIFYHLSNRYTNDVEYVLNTLVDNFPNVFIEYCEVAIDSLFSEKNEEQTTSIDYERFINSYGCISLSDYLSYAK